MSASLVGSEMCIRDSSHVPKVAGADGRCVGRDLRNSWGVSGFVSARSRKNVFLFHHFLQDYLDSGVGCFAVVVRMAGD